MLFIYKSIKCSEMRDFFFCTIISLYSQFFIHNHNENFSIVILYWNLHFARWIFDKILIFYCDPLMKFAFFYHNSSNDICIFFQWSFDWNLWFLTNLDFSACDPLTKLIFLPQYFDKTHIFFPLYFYEMCVFTMIL